MALEKYVIEWLKANGFERVVGNEELAKALYAENNKATRTSVMLEGMKVAMPMIVTSEAKKGKDVRICMKCNNKECRKDCGFEEYEVRNGLRCRAGDPFEGGSVVTLNFPPWYKGNLPKINSLYVVSGVAKKDNRDNLEIHVYSIEEKSLSELETLVPIIPKIAIKTSIAKVVVTGNQSKSHTYEEAKAMVISLFDLNENRRTPTQLRDYMRSQKIQDFYDQVVTDLKLEVTDEGLVYTPS